MRGKAKYIAALGGTLVFSSPFLMQHLQAWEEGPRRQLVVYADKLAGGLPTVCMGLTRHVTSTPIIVGQRWTEEKCQREEAAAVEALQNRLVNCFAKLPPQSVWDMATSHGWNLGPQATCTSGAMAAWNRGDWQLGCDRISRGDDGRLVWSYVSYFERGVKKYKFVQGLANRRADETVKCQVDVRPATGPA